MTYSYALGIDLHKKQSTWKLVDKNHKVIFSKTVLCQPKDIEAALVKLPVSLNGLPVAIEPTCGYRWVDKLLTERGCDMHVANPYKFRVIANSKQKTDDADAKVLAEFLQLGYLPESWRTPDHIEKRRTLVRVRDSLVKARTRIKNQIEGLLTNECPITSRKTLPPDLKFQELNSLIKEHTSHIKNFDKEINRIVIDDPVCKLLLSVPGVGPISAFAIVAEVGDFSRFPDSSKLASFAGIVPSQRSSGETVRYGHIVKTGSKLLRTTLIEAAMRFRPPYDHNLNVFFERLKKDRGAMRARVALAHKLLTIIYSMVKNNKPFVPSYDTAKLGDLF